MEQQPGRQLSCGEMSRATAGGTQGQQCGVSHYTHAALPEREPGLCGWGRTRDGNPTSKERVPVAGKHPADCQRKGFFCSRKVFNNSGLLDAAL